VFEVLVFENAIFEICFVILIFNPNIIFGFLFVLDYPVNIVVVVIVHLVKKTKINILDNLGKMVRGGFSIELHKIKSM
jgi:hypothetical protein